MKPKKLILIIAIGTASVIGVIAGWITYEQFQLIIQALGGM